MALAMIQAPVDAADLQVAQAWARATPRRAEVGAAYLTIGNAAPAPDRLIGLSSPAAARLSLHETERDGDVARMRAVPELVIGAASTVEMRPGSMHVMLEGLVAPLKATATFPMTLRFERAGEITIEVIVGRPGAAGPSPSGTGASRHHQH